MSEDIKTPDSQVDVDEMKKADAEQDNLDQVEVIEVTAGDAARPFLVSNEKKMNLNITISTSPLGQQGMRGSEPFYIKGQGRVDNLGDDED